MTLHLHRVDGSPNRLHKQLIWPRRWLFEVINDLRLGALLLKDDTLHVELFDRVLRVVNRRVDDVEVSAVLRGITYAEVDLYLEFTNRGTTPSQAAQVYV